MSYAAAGALTGQKWTSDPLELKLHAVVSCLRWVLGTKRRSSAESCLVGFNLSGNLDFPWQLVNTNTGSFGPVIITNNNSQATHYTSHDEYTSIHV